MRVIQNSIQWLQQQFQNPSVNDQHAFTHVYKRTIGATVTLLPQEEYPNGAVYFQQGKTQKAKMVHCNYISTTSQKIERLQEHNLWNVNDEAFDLANKYYI